MNTSSGQSPWRKSSYSSGGQSTCVEVAAYHGTTLVRDTTDRQGPTLAVGAPTWTRFLSTIR
jgi:Domain of unknown function (DUF397)